MRSSLSSIMTVAVIFALGVASSLLAQYLFQKWQDSKSIGKFSP